MSNSSTHEGRGATVQERHRDAIKRFLKLIMAGTTNREAYEAVALVDREYYGGWWQARDIADAIAKVADNERTAGHAGQCFDPYAVYRHLLNEGRFAENYSLQEWVLEVIAPGAGHRVPTTASLRAHAHDISTSWLRVLCCDYLKDEGVAYWPLTDLIEYALRATEKMQRVVRRMPRIDYLEETTAA